MMMAIRPWKSFLELFIFLYFTYLLAAAAQYHDYPSAKLSASWTNNNLSAINITQPLYYPQLYSQLIMRIILLKLPNPSSGNGFACGFVYDLSTGSSFLATASVRIRTGLEDVFWSDVEVFWLANRNKPVHENATLQLHTNGDLILRDADGSFVWSTNTSHMSAVDLQMLKTGNLVLFDGNNKTIWQSFDHPTDTLLPGQKLMAGQKLVSRASTTNWTEGGFYLSVSSEGLFAFYRSTVPQMYFRFSVSGIKESEQPSYIRAVNGTLALYILSAEPSEPDAVLSMPVNYTEYAYMRLDSDGHLRFYYDSMNQVDILAGDLEECDYPTVCGNYGLCSDGQCSCPYGFDQNNVSDKQSNFGCTEINPVTCENGQSQSLIPLKDVYYFNYVDPDVADLKGIHMGSCRDACLRNCSCKVAMFRFYYNISHGNCFLLSNVLSLMNEGQGRSPYNSYAFIKLPNDQESQRLSSASVPPTRAIAGITVGTFVLVVLVVGFCILCLRKKRNMDGDVEDYFDQLSGMPMRFSYEDLKLATEDFQRKLGEGGFFFEGTLVSGEKVAAKRLDALGQGKKEFLAEVKTVGSIHHVNLVRLIGFCAENLHRLLVYEFMCNGSLDKWIFNRIPQQPALDLQTRKTIILDIAKGLAYLHEECRQRIVHLDIKPQNILLDVNLRAKISDFGLSKLIDKDQSQVVTTMRGTPGYLAPELFSSIVTEKADVYSFGIVVMEVVCGRKNLDRSHSEGCIHLLPFFMIKAEDDCLIDLVDKDSEDMQLHGEEVVQMMRVAVWCLQNDYNRRPSMSTVVKVLEGTMEFEASLTAITREPEEQFGGATTSSLLPSILSGPR
ncbi:hypothetical protein Q3G72_001882 [Acer saccharum]|nr:hypothetical protein Q3G72_001882 [Acer saccharum]